MRNAIFAVTLLTLASCSDGAPAGSAVPDDAAVADALARGEALENPVDVGAELPPAKTSPTSSGGAAGGAPTAGTGGAGGSGGATSTGGSGGAADAGDAGAGGAQACQVPAGSMIQSQYCTALAPSGGTRALRRDGRYLCLKGCVAVRPGNLPVAAYGPPTGPECVTPLGGLCVGDCGTCE
jgi:hypothetical protein